MKPILTGLSVACAVLDLLFDDHVGLEEEIVLLRIGGELALCQVGADEREIRAAKHLEHEIEAVVELVVSERADSIAKRVHRLDDRVDVAILHAVLIGHVIAHRIALQQVTVVDQQGVGRFGADVIDDRRGARQTHRVVRLVGIVVVWENVDMDVGGFHEPQMRLIGGRARREGVEQNKRRSRGNAAKQ